MACGVVLAPKWPNFDNFHQKRPILTKLTPLMTFLTKYKSINLTEIFLETFSKKYFWPNSLNFGLCRHFGPKMTQFWQFSPKTNYFDKIDPINAIFDQIYVHNFIPTQNLDLWRHFGPKMTQFWPFSPKTNYFDEIYPLMTLFTKFMSIKQTEIIFRNL